MKNIMKKYNAFSFIELLLTMMLLGVIMLLVTSTLMTTIKVSTTTASKNLTRSDINYVMEVFQRSLRNADVDNIYLYDSRDVRYVTEGGNGQIRIGSDVNLGETYSTSTVVDQGNEIHVKLVGYEYWTCIGYFPGEDIDPQTDQPYGYIVKTTYNGTSLIPSSECFNKDAVITLLHSYTVDATEDFNIQKIVTNDENSMYVIDVTLRPLQWPVSNVFPVTREVSRQVVVSTQSLTSY